MTGGTDEGRRVLVVVNPLMAWRRRRLLAEVLRQLDGLAAAIEVREARYPGDAEALAREARGRHDVIVAAGGDGTVNEIVNGLAGAGMPLALLPLGTANVLAAEIGLPARPRRLAELIARGRPRPVHLGRVDGRRFVMMAGVGLDAHAVAAVASTLKRLAGKPAYGVALLWQLLRYPCPLREVSVDGAVWRAAAVIVANGHFYAGRFVCAPGARLEVPGFHVCLFLSPGRWRAVRYGVALLLGRLHRLADYRVVEARRVVIQGPPGEPVQADGDVVAALPVEITVAPEPLNLIMPGASRRAAGDAM